MCVCVCVGVCMRLCICVYVRVRIIVQDNNSFRNVDLEHWYVPIRAQVCVCVWCIVDNSHFSHNVDLRYLYLLFKRVSGGLHRFEAYLKRFGKRFWSLAHV